jgi:hypothetical protein
LRSWLLVYLVSVEAISCNGCIYRLDVYFFVCQGNRLSDLIHFVKAFNDFDIQDDQNSGSVSGIPSRLQSSHVLLAFDRIRLVRLESNKASLLQLSVTHNMIGL